MTRNVHIIGTGIYNPKRTADNNYFVNHFEKYGIGEQVDAILKKIGREITYFVDEDEDDISMSLEAAKQALADSNLSSLDIDMIISASDTPEFLSPTCALMLKSELKANNVKGVFDVNNDCLAMINAIDIATKYLKSDKNYKRVLVVGSVMTSPYAREDDLMVYATVSDGAAAIVLEAREEDKPRGFIGSRLFADDSYIYTIRFPVCGLSNIYRQDISVEDKKMKSIPFDFSFISDKWSQLINGLLDEHNTSINEVSHYFMSQFSVTDIEETLDKLGVFKDKATFIGDRYGYAGCASPIMALDYRIREKKFQQDELVVFCSAGAGYTTGALLYKW